MRYEQSNSGGGRSQESFGFLSSLENRKRGDKDRYSCHPSYRTIGNAIGRSSRSVAKYAQELVEAGLILAEPTKVTTKDGQRWNGNLKYKMGAAPKELPAEKQGRHPITGFLTPITITPRYTPRKSRL